MCQLIKETTSFKINFSKFLLLLLDHNRFTKKLLRSICITLFTVPGAILD